MAKPARVHLTYLDGLRGWASLFVVLHHLWQFVRQLDRPPTPPWFKILAIFKSGPLAVTLFIVLSGYSLMIPVARSEDASLAGGRRGFFMRRARRILPAYYATILVSLALVLAFPAMRRPSGTQWDIALPALSIENLLLHVGLLHNLVPPWPWKLNPPLWSVALEWQIYFLFALVLLPIWRRAGHAAALAAACVIGLLPLAFGLAYVHSWYLVSFALGMWAASVNFSKTVTSPWLQRTPWGVVCLVCLAPATVWLGMLKGNLNDVNQWLPLVFAHLSVSVAAAAFLIRSTRELVAERPSLLVRALAHRWSAALGHFSYSLYLLHYPLLAIMCVPLREYHLSGLSLFLILLAGVPPILYACHLFHLVFEKPFMRQR